MNDEENKETTEKLIKLIDEIMEEFNDVFEELSK